MIDFEEKLCKAAKNVRVSFRISLILTECESIMDLSKERTTERRNNYDLYSDI